MSLGKSSLEQYPSRHKAKVTAVRMLNSFSLFGHVGNLFRKFYRSLFFHIMAFKPLQGLRLFLFSSLASDTEKHKESRKSNKNQFFALGFMP